MKPFYKTIIHQIVESWLETRDDDVIVVSNDNGGYYQIETSNKEIVIHEIMKGTH